MHYAYMDTPPPQLAGRIREGLDRVAAVLHSDQWGRATALQLNPTQLAILDLLDARPDGMGVKAIARHLGVSQPTATDSVAALARKGLLTRRGNPADRRALTIALSAAGRDLLAPDTRPGLGEQAIGMLSAADQAMLLTLLVKAIAQLQRLDAIPIQRMCVTCSHFAPQAHPGADRPHHCRFVDAPIGQRDIRIDCRDHVAADADTRTAALAAFGTTSAPLPADALPKEAAKVAARPPAGRRQETTP